MHKPKGRWEWSTAHGLETLMAAFFRCPVACVCIKAQAGMHWETFLSLNHGSVVGQSTLCLDLAPQGVRLPYSKRVRSDCRINERRYSTTLCITSNNLEIAPILVCFSTLPQRVREAQGNFNSPSDPPTVVSLLPRQDVD